MAKKTEFKIGEVFKLGLMKIRAEKRYDKMGCRECYFYEFCCDCEEEFRYNIIGSCDGRERKDGTDVIFKEVK